MKEFLDAIAAGLTGFPPILATIFINGGSAFAGGVIATIIAARTSLPPMLPNEILGHFLVCWLTGAILGPSIVSPLVGVIAKGIFSAELQPVVKLPDYALCFLTSGVGWWLWTKYIPKKQNDLLNKPNTPPGDGSAP